MKQHLFFLSGVTAIALLFAVSHPAPAGTVGGPNEPPDEEIVRIVYPDGQLTKDAKGRIVIQGGKHAEANVFTGEPTPKIIERIDRLRGRLYRRETQELVVLINALNEEAANCCGGEAVLAVFDLRGEKAKPIWIHRLQQMRLGEAQVSLVEANSYGTQQILLEYGSRIGRTAIIYIPRPAPSWSPPGNWSKSESLFWIKEDPPDQPFVKIWFGNLKWDEGPWFYYEYSPQPRGSDFARAAYTSKIWFSEARNPGDVWEGWRELIEERTITMLLGKKLDPPLKVQVRYEMGIVYFLAGR